MEEVPMLEQMKKRLTPREVEQAAYRVVYADVEALAQAQAREHTIANLGASIRDFIGGHTKPEHVLDRAWNTFRESYGSEMGDEGEGIEEEYRDWLKTSRHDAAAVAQAGLPLTLENCRHSFERTGPFAKVRS